MKNNKWLIGGLLFALLILLFLYMAGVFTPKLPTELQSVQRNVMTLETVTLEAVELPAVREFAGRVVANQRASIGARLTATVAEVLVDVGDEVKQGDVLLRLESDDLDARVQQTEQALSSAQARLNIARKEYARMKELFNKKLIPVSQYDQADSALKSAYADFNQQKAAVVEAETTFGFSVITAPFDGVITQKPVNQGDIATAGMLLLSMYNPESLLIEVNVSESVLPKIALGEMLSVTLPSYKIALLTQINEITPAADSGSRSYLIRLGFKTDKTLYPGSYAKVMVETDTDKVLKVPVEAIYQVGQLDYVRIIKEGKLQTRLIQVGEDYRVRKGLVEGDVVVLNPGEI
ncbi:efflux RND transporter periplasmic adaptor subunit [Vibrio sp. 404]|uniref:Efflux RND transporter periplasmic adaptor subunit n=1 Tax=Vibrio marinisediminis TaxID=2758441 RepID=A0A7W2FTG9_9VIBR|nr:efflux RND transporter periplasmic adaptor subunit [Vibrio marinisediminis]MBA5763948.1 efflux RND transporter periplasmic adaptor subunit [Vibrio marinisediminis]